MNDEAQAEATSEEEIAEETAKPADDDLKERAKALKLEARALKRRARADNAARTRRGLAALRRGAGASWLIQATVLVALAAATVTAVLQWREAGRLTDEAATQREVRTKAGEFGQALLGYDHTDLKSSHDRINAITTPDFAKFYDVSFSGSGGLEGVITKVKATAKATVRQVYLTEIDGGRAKAVIVMDTEVRSTAGTRRVLGSYLDLELVRQKGQWKVNSVASVGAVNESMTDPQGKPKKP